MKKYTNLLAFTFVELIVTAVIIVILTTIWFYNYSGHMLDARDAERKSDIATIGSALSNYKQKKWAFPLPWDYFILTNSGSYEIVKQGRLNLDVPLTTLDKLPSDPYIEVPYYYSITKNRQEYQVAATLENNWLPRALLQGNYKSVSRNILPSLMIADDISGAVKVSEPSIQKKFILDNGSHNLPYNFETWIPVSDGTNFDIIINDPNINFWQNVDYRTCDEIYESGKSIGTGTYELLDEEWNLFSSGCFFAP